MNMGSYNCCTPDKQEFHKIVSLSHLIKLIGEESRLKILCILRQGEHCVCEIIEHLSLSQSLISHHLKDLKDAGLVHDKKKGQLVYYSLTEKGKHVTNLLFSIPKKEV